MEDKFKLLYKNIMQKSTIKKDEAHMSLAMMKLKLNIFLIKSNKNT